MSNYDDITVRRQSEAFSSTVLTYLVDRAALDTEESPAEAMVYVESLILPFHCGRKPSLTGRKGEHWISHGR